MVVQSLPLSFGGFPKQSASCPGESLLSFHRYCKKFDLILHNHERLKAADKT
jgi:hypothetical protein